MNVEFGTKRDIDSWMQLVTYMIFCLSGIIKT